MATRITIEDTFENSQEVRDRHWFEGGQSLFGTHRINCPYCYKRMKGEPLPTLKLVLRLQDADGFEEREILDKHDPRYEG